MLHLNTSSDCDNIHEVIAHNLFTTTRSEEIYIQRFPQNSGKSWEVSLKLHAQ